ncbi:hypothetical protein [Mesorhizobium neociceri]|uniref:Uncharacterized protein n=1 Tax=Mesorhizobium neociceri TaxID=1307853 RepID=A0A838B5N0_9HYPH|nr:hypothetical protein [Mesorhizobium neociceri]MBA1141705.1 hypothetical protein [Mesorhizobium neociceri]
MNPTLIHRFTIPLHQAIEQLVGKEATDGEGYIVDIDGDELIIDILGPANTTFRIGAYEYTIEGRGEAASDEVAEINTPAETPAEPPPRKGGPLAQRAAIACGEKGFWTFILKRYHVGVGSADEAAAWLKTQCGISSRVDLDHEEVAAGIYREIDKLYRLWLEGFDV